MESEVKLKGGRGADQRMITFGTKKGNGTIEIMVGVKHKSNMAESELERKEGRGADRTDSRSGTQETMMAHTWIAMVTFTVFLKALASNCGNKNERARPQDERGDCLSRRAKLKFESSIDNIVDLARCENPKVEEDVEQLNIRRGIRMTNGIESRVWKNAEEGRIIRSNDSQLKIRDWMSRIKRNPEGPMSILL
jgi:hypothetical protein